MSGGRRITDYATWLVPPHGNSTRQDSNLQLRNAALYQTEIPPRRAGFEPATFG